MSTITLNSEQFNLLLQEIKDLRTEVRLLHGRLDRKHFTPAEAAETWEISRRTVDRWINSGKIRIIRVNNRPKIPLEEVIRVQNDEI